MRGLAGKRALVTGGLGDLGSAAITRLLEEGCRVASIDLKEDAAGTLASAGVYHQAVDISDEAGVQAACRSIHERVGPIDVLVNSAARFIFRSAEATAAEWHDILAVNVVGTSLVTKHIIPQMKEAGGGSIIVLSSVSGFVGQANFATYNATKFALRGLVKCWAQDFAADGIRVNTVCPGYIYTRAFVDSCAKLGLDIEAENSRASAMHLLNRQGKPAEVAAAIAFLASDDASFITGSDLVVDGGYLAR